MPDRIPLMLLIVHVPGGEDRRIEIKDWRTVIGRSSKTDLKIVSKQISKIHAAIEIDDSVPYVRDLGSRNGVEVNGRAITQPERLRPGDILTIGDAVISVDTSSLVFRPHEAQVALQALLTQQAALRAQEDAASAAHRSQSSSTVNQSFVPTRQSPLLVGRPVGNASGDPPVVRMLRIAADHGPYDIARIEAFLLELADGQLVWIKPNLNVEIAHPNTFTLADNVWIDEPEDFGGPGAHVMIIARQTFYLPRRIEVIGSTEIGRTPDGRRIFSEAAPHAAMVIAPAS